MEAHVAASKVHLLKALKFDGSTVVPYISGKSQISVHGSGAYGAGSSRSRVARFEISASAGSMLDLKSLELCGTVHNRVAAPVPSTVGEIPPPDTKAIQFLSLSLTGLMESARITIGGTEVSSCDYIARTGHILSILQSDDVRHADHASGLLLVNATTSGIHGRYKIEGIPSVSSRDALCRFRSLGVLNMDSMLPISMCLGGVMVLEITWANSQAECCSIRIATQTELKDHTHASTYNYYKIKETFQPERGGPWKE
jgi:hypothetical protein